MKEHKAGTKSSTISNIAVVLILVVLLLLFLLATGPGRMILSFLI